LFAAMLCCWASAVLAADAPTPGIAAVLDRALKAESRAERMQNLEKELAAAGFDWSIPALPISSPEAQGGTPAEPQVVPLELLANAAGFPQDRDFFARLGDAQTAPAKIIVLSHGAYTLGQVSEALAKRGKTTLVSFTNGEGNLNAPIYVGPKAVLMMRGGTYSLNAATGSFIVSAGRLVLNGVTLTGSASAERRRPDGDPVFRPFVLVGGGTLDATDSHFTGLGGSGELSAAVALIGLTGKVAEPTSIAGNLFEDGYGLRIDRSSGVTVSGNEMRRLTGPGVRVSRSTGIEIDANAIHDVSGSQGILLNEGARQNRVTGNLLARNQTGIAVTSGAGGNLIGDNLILVNKGAGVGLYGARCNVVSGNGVIANGGDGIAWREGEVAISGNRITWNGGAGVSSQGTDAAARRAVVAEGLALKDNLISRNRIGLRVDRAAWVSFDNNRFIGQSPRIFSGALGIQLAAYLGASGSPMRFVAEKPGQFKPGDVAASCGPVENK
jgi:hypothetical protein